MAAGTRLVCSGAKREIVSGCYRLHRFNQFSREKGATAAGRIRHSFHWAARRVSFEERWSLKCLCAIVPLCLAPDKTMIAKQVPGHLFELHVKSGRHSSAFVLL